MRVLVVGAGGREHALVWKLSQSPKVTQILCAPGNAGIGRLAKRVSIGPGEIDRLVAMAQDQKVDLTVVGPEAPLCAGIADTFREHGLKLFGPTKLAAEIEGSKAFCRDLLRRWNVPSPSFEICGSWSEAEDVVRRWGAPIVVKADGLAAGKGTFVCATREEAIKAIDLIMRERIFGRSGDRVVIEEFLEGREVSVMVITDGTTVKPLPPSKDHKRLQDNDQGPNTGGMGAYCPVPFVPPPVFDTIVEGIMKRTLTALAAEDRPYLGVLYGGLILTRDGPKVLEFNCRFGDPETQAVLPLTECDLADLCLATVEGKLHQVSVGHRDGACVAVVMASRGYPGEYEKGKEIVGIEEAERIDGVVVFHAGTERKDGKLVTAGGRVLCVAANGPNFKDAVERAYRGVAQIRFEGAQFRRDIRPPGDNAGVER